MSFSQTRLFGKFARTRIRPSTPIFTGSFATPPLRVRRGPAFRGGVRRLAHFPPASVAPYPRDMAGWSTQMRPQTPCLCSLRFTPAMGRIRLDTQLVSVARPGAFLFKETCLIFGLELLSLTVSFEEIGPRLAGKSVWIYMGSNNFLSALWAIPTRKSSPS